MSFLTRKLWDWPDGLVWKITEGATLKSRREKYDLFLARLAPKPQDTILDVGVSPFLGRGTNYLELWYPHPYQITALAHEDNAAHFANFKQAYPQIRLVFGDGKRLPFPDNHFNIVFCNAVLEHVGPCEEQRKLIGELLRVGQRAFITTPNAGFPIDSHTLIPGAHWLPPNIRYPLYRRLGRAYWADVNVLNLLSEQQFTSLFPPACNLNIHRQRSFGWTHTLIATAQTGMPG